MTDANFYPLFISLARKICVVCGYGKVGFRKLSGLRNVCPESIRVYDLLPFEDLDEERKNLLRETNAIYSRGSCSEADLRGVFLAFAATSNVNYNIWLANVCEKLNILCDCVSPGSAGNCLVPAVARAYPLVAAISSSGFSPALAKLTRTELESWLKPRALLARLLGELRETAKTEILSEEARRAFFRDLAASQCGVWLSRGFTESCLDWLEEKFPRVPRERLLAIMKRVKNV